MAVEAPKKGLLYFTVGVKYVGLKYRFRFKTRFENS